MSMNELQIIFYSIKGHTKIETLFVGPFCVKVSYKITFLSPLVKCSVTVATHYTTPNPEERSTNHGKAQQSDRSLSFTNPNHPAL